MRSGVAPQQHGGGSVVGHVGGEPSGERHGHVRRQPRRPQPSHPPRQLGSARRERAGRDGHAGRNTARRCRWASTRPSSPASAATTASPRFGAPSGRSVHHQVGTLERAAVGVPPPHPGNREPGRTRPPRGRRPRWRGPTTRASRPRRCAGAPAGAATWRPSTSRIHVSWLLPNALRLDGRARGARVEVLA